MKKLTPILILLGCLLLSAHSYGQTVTISRKNASLKEILEAVYKQTGYYYYGNAEIMAKAKKIEINVKDASLSEALEICFKDQPLGYTIENKTILVSEKPALTTATATPEPVDLKGKVMNEKEEPLPGATITVKGTNRSVLTDPNGNFILPGFDDRAVLQVSSVGYETRELRPGKSHYLEIHLHLVDNKLDEVQVIAYGTVTNRLNTGDVSTVKSSVIGQQPVSNVLEALEGRVSGLYIQQFTGVPGGNYQVQLRGQNSLRSDGNDPLYIVDGVPFISEPLSSLVLSSANGATNPLNSINPADIESIEVLKDADATAIYGSRGANGVILITTKKGKSGKTKTEFNLSAGSGRVAHKMDLLNTDQWLRMRYEALKNDGWLGYLVPQYAKYFPDLMIWDTTRNTNWQKQLIGGTSAFDNAQLSLSGGNAGTHFLVAGGYIRQTTVFPGNFADQKGSVHINLDHISNNHKFAALFSAGYTSDNNNLLQTDLTSIAVGLAPDAPAIYNADGSLNWESSTWNNPYSNLLKRYKNGTDNLIANSVLTYELLPGLKLKASLGYTSTRMNEISTFPLRAVNPAFGATSGNAFNAENNIKTWILEPQAEYLRQLGKSKISLLAGATAQQSIQQGQTLEGLGYPNDALLENLQSASSIVLSAANYTQYRYDGFFARLNFNREDKYLVNLTGRRDGSSRFGPGRQVANFGAIGVAWIFSKEGLIKNSLAFLSFGKLRAGYGITGSDQIGDYKYLDSYASTPYAYQGAATLIPTQLANSDYSWEINRKLSLALQLGFLHDRLLLSGNYYYNRSSNQLVGYPLATITGFSSVEANFPATVRNSGWEIELNTVNLKSGNLHWTSSFNISIPDSKLLAYPGLASSGFATTYVVGKSLFIADRFHYTGIDPKTGQYTFSAGDSTGVPTYPDDLHALKKITQSYYGGLLNSFSYRGFQLDIFFQFVKQTGRSYLGSFPNPPGSSYNNQPTLILNHWQQPGDKTNIQSFTQTIGGANDAYRNALQSDLAITDASFIRLKNISLSYSIPPTLLSRLHIQQFRVYFQGQNLFTLTKYVGFDPENQNDQVLPPLRVLTAGIQLTL